MSQKFIIIDEDGTELSSPDSDSNDKQSSSDNEFEEVYVDSRQDHNDSPILNEYVTIDDDEMESLDDESTSSRSEKSMPKEVTKKQRSADNRSGRKKSRSRAQGDDKKSVKCEKVADTNFVAEFPLSPPISKKPEKMIDEMLRLYNNFALANMSAACFRDASVSKKLLEPYRVIIL